MDVEFSIPGMRREVEELLTDVREEWKLPVGGAEEDRSSGGLAGVETDTVELGLDEEGLAEGSDALGLGRVG